MSAASAKIVAALGRHKKLFDLTRDDLGRRLCKVATDGVQECIAGQHAPDGSPWPPLDKHYEEWKSFHFPGLPMGVLHQHMANPHEVAGEVVVTADGAKVTYGISDLARREASWFQDPEDGRQPPRRFWGLTEKSRAESRNLLDKRFKDGIR
jgi:hypothetical protein